MMLQNPRTLTCIFLLQAFLVQRLCGGPHKPKRLWMEVESFTSATAIVRVISSADLELSDIEEELATQTVA